MPANLGPAPLLAPLARAHVAEHRSLFCRSYDACLGRAAQEGWASWSCARCARFSPPPRAAASPARATGPSRSSPPPPAAPRVNATKTPPPRRVPTHSVEVENDVVHVRLDAPSIPALFVEAARAVGEMMIGRPLDPLAEWAEDVSIAAPDLEHLLVAWIRELALRSEWSSVRFTHCEIVHLTDHRIVASLGGLRLGWMRNPLDASTCRDPSLVRCGDHVTAAPVLDLERGREHDGSSPSDRGWSHPAPA